MEINTQSLFKMHYPLNFALIAKLILIIYMEYIFFVYFMIIIKLFFLILAMIY